MKFTMGDTNESRAEGLDRESVVLWESEDWQRRIVENTFQGILMGVAGAIKSRSFIIALHINKLSFYAQR